MDDKKVYQSPELVVYGTLSDLTEAGASKAGLDGIFYEEKGYFGSVIRPID
jgi:hypothetical protein